MNPLRKLLLGTILLLCACGTSREPLGSASSLLTIGDTTVESTADDGNGNLLVAQSATLGEAATLQSLSFYVTSATGKLRLGVYAANGPSGGPGTKLAETGEMTPTTGWNTASATAVELQPGTYWLAYFPSNDGLAFRKQPNVTSSKYYSLTYGVLPATFSTSPNTSGSRWSLYATLTPTGSGGAGGSSSGGAAGAAGAAGASGSGGSGGTTSGGTGGSASGGTSSGGSSSGAAGTSTGGTAGSAGSSGSAGSAGAGGSGGGVSDPCAGVTCNSPPATTCVGASVRHYTAPGACDEGSCSYDSTDVVCPNGCTAGHCIVVGMPGPLVPSPNPNYFEDTNGHALGLFGSHTWNNLQDWGTGGTPHALDFDDYVDFLTAHGHNFTLLWTTELPKFCGLPTIANGGSPDFTTDLQPWARTGPGTASDGLPKFDLGQFNDAYFDRLRARVTALHDAGIWAGVYLFSGEWLAAFRCSTDGYPLTGGNNVNGIDAGTGTGAYTMTAPNAITAVQDAMAAHTIEALNDLPNVLWIVSEEAPAGSLWWQGHMIDFVHTLEMSQPLQHPVGVATIADGSQDDDLIDLNSDWFAPVARLSPTTTCGAGTPACKVSINDSDHSYFGMWNESAQANRQYAWENFALGNQVVFMDPYLVYYPRESRNLCSSPSNGICSAPDSRWDSFRDNLGYLVSYAERMDLAAAEPDNALCSTGYCLGHVAPFDTELLVYAPTGGAVTVDLSGAGCTTVNYEWFDPATGLVVGSGSLAGGSPSQALSTPSGVAADGVLFLSAP